MRKPYFSILIASYNRPEYIERCIRSVLENDFDDYELIISDDNSPRTKEIKEIVNKFMVNHSNIIYYRQSVNLKEPDNKTFLANVAKGKYYIQLGDDDTLLKNTLCKLKAYISSFPESDIYAFGYNVIDENDKVLFSRKGTKKMEICLSKPNLIKELIAFDIFPFWFFHPSVFCAKSGLESEFPYSNKAGIGEDYQLLIEILGAGKKISVIPDILFNWRKIQNFGNANQINQSHDRRQNIIARKNIYYNYLLKNNNLNPFISNYVSAYTFRKKFIYNPLFVDPALKNNFVEEIGLLPEHYNEFLHYYKIHNRTVMRMVGKINRFRKYIIYNGISGLIEMCRLIYSKKVF